VSTYPGYFWSDYRKTRMEGLRWTLQMTDRTLSGIPTVKLEFKYSSQSGTNSRHPAYSVLDQITIHRDKVRDIHSDRGVATVLGMNYHELAHVIYTMYDFEAIRSRATGLTALTNPSKLEDAYNILEEGRVESLLAARYPRFEKYFTLLVADYIVGEPDPDTYLLVYGRKYLPKKVRGILRQRYVAARGKDITEKAENLIDRYRTVLFPKNIPKAAKIIGEFAKLLPDDHSAKPNHGKPHGTSGRKEFGDTAQQQEQDLEKSLQKGDGDEAGDDGAVGVQDGGDPGDDSGKAPDAGGGKGAQGDGSQPGASGAGELDGDDGQSGDGKRGGGSADPGGTGPSESDGSGAGKGAGKHVPGVAELKELLDGLTDEILADSMVQSDIRNARGSMDDTRNGLHSSLDHHPARKEVGRNRVTEDMRRRSEGLAQELRRIWLSLEPGWLYGASEGRLDMNRVFGATTPEELEDVYASWDEGQQHNSAATGVILVDESESMNYPVPTPYGKPSPGYKNALAARALWEIKNACREVDAKVAVITYDSSCRMLYEFDEEADHDFFLYPRNNGGTNALAALKEARRILSQAEAPGKFLIALTDGQWDDSSYEIRECLQSMPGVVKATGLIGFRDGTRFMYEDDFDIVRRTSGDVFPLMSEVVTQIMSRNMEGSH
jgi:hypothetical protein